MSGPTVRGQRPGWWQDAVIYQVYPRSFADGDGDGVGDLAGLLDRLPYIASLGVDGIWMTPFQPSPQVDQGYDVSDYCAVDPLFGTMEQFDQVLEAAHALGLRIFLDVVPNHCSSEHPLFQAAVAADSGSPERAMFHFENGVDDDTPPNNWQSVFGGRAWSRVNPGSDTDKEWYLHLFSPEQPDWNWRNPAVGDYFEGVLRFWFDKGVDGLRIDVAHALFKADGLPDTASTDAVVDGLRSNPQVSDQDEVHEVYRRWRRVADSYSPTRVLVGEVNLEPHRAARYTRHDEMHQAFAFAFVKLGWDAAAWAAVGTELEAARKEHGAPLTWALENHDIVRSVTRFGGGERGTLRARAGLLAVLGLPGGAYIYQGQELNLPEAEVPLHARADPMWTRAGVSRDGARVPLPWTVAAENTYGFSPAGAADPWLPVPAAWGSRSVQMQLDDPASTLQLVTEALRVRRELIEKEILSPDDATTWHVQDNGLLLCERGDRFLLAVAMGEEPCALPQGSVVLASSPLTDAGLLPADSAVWLLREDSRT
ncbi:alpha-amylase family glycosyl hydrolase [Arthrobacter sp. zg-Y895]|uniref:alpha-amylase family glycosyl hydrolase n=1 Tax=Arthrobacter sp. zg-Y895 TaxID=2886933 RepID=UPI001D13C308|nr:alpha-amylase family glycosyl hydrolase [Arthrobacter sp. zg-Y895]MCC3300687.1 alpha-amylase [Arthrobacter sp. zg-Y895]